MTITNVKVGLERIEIERDLARRMGAVNESIDAGGFGQIDQMFG